METVCGWVNKCRMEYKAEKLTQERIRDLEAFDNWEGRRLIHD